MNVVNFLKLHSVDKLKSDFSIKVKTYSQEGLIVLNYTIFSPDNNPIVKECRSLILTTDYRIVSRSFDRFLNYNEMSEMLHIDDGECYAKEKIDGSLIKFYKFNGKWCVSTRGLAFAEGYIQKATNPITYKQAVYEALDISHTDDDDKEFQQFCQYCNMDENYTYILELTGKDNRVITEYNPNKYELWLLGIRRNDAVGEYLYYAGLVHDKIVKPKVYYFQSVTECVDQANNLTGLQEGFVICNKITGQPLCKVKSSKYVSFHSAITNGAFSSRDIWKLIANEDWKEFVAYFPEYNDVINKHLETLRQYFITADMEFEKISKTMKFENEFSVFDKKLWKPLAIIAIKNRQTNLFEIFTKTYDWKKKLNFFLKAINVE